MSMHEGPQSAPTQQNEPSNNKKQPSTLSRLWAAIKNGLQSIRNKIASLFGKLFNRSKANQKPETNPIEQSQKPPVASQGQEQPSQSNRQQEQPQSQSSPTPANIPSKSRAEQFAERRASEAAKLEQAKTKAAPIVAEAEAFLENHSQHIDASEQKRLKDMIEYIKGTGLLAITQGGPDAFQISRNAESIQRSIEHMTKANLPVNTPSPQVPAPAPQPSSPAEPLVSEADKLKQTQAQAAPIVAEAPVPASTQPPITTTPEPDQLEAAQEEARKKAEPIIQEAEVYLNQDHQKYLPLGMAASLNAAIKFIRLSPKENSVQNIEEHTEALRQLNAKTKTAVDEARAKAAAIATATLQGREQDTDGKKTPEPVPAQPIVEQQPPKTLEEVEQKIANREPISIADAEFVIAKAEEISKSDTYGVIISTLRLIKEGLTGSITKLKNLSPDDPEKIQQAEKIVALNTEALVDRIRLMQQRIATAKETQIKAQTPSGNQPTAAPSPVAQTPAATVVPSPMAPVNESTPDDEVHQTIAKIAATRKTVDCNEIIAKVGLENIKHAIDVQCTEATEIRERLMKINPTNFLCSQLLTYSTELRTMKLTLDTQVRLTLVVRELDASMKEAQGTIDVASKKTTLKP